jgi:hypothetical protein
MHTVYNPTTMNRLPGKTNGYFDTERAAKAALTRAVNSGVVTNRNDWKIGTWADFDADDSDIEVISAFDGKTKCTIKKSVRGTACDPSTERHWTM